MANKNLFQTVKRMFTPRADTTDEAGARAVCGDRALPLAKLNRQRATCDVLIYVSDNESWIDSNRSWNSGTDTMTEWDQFKTRNRNAKLVCLDIQPNASTQAQERADILNIGGFSDTVFDVVSEFSKGTLNAEHWVGVIEKVEI